jgi:sugar phosphate isomerase/epimerase
MNKLSRRQFFGISALGMGAFMLPGNAGSGIIPIPPPSPAGIPVGFQVWTVKDMLIKDFPGTLKSIASMGYQAVEMCSPPGYESSGFGPLMKISAKEMKKIIKGAGLKFLSSHYGMDELRKDLDKRIEFALDSGQKQMILSSFGLPADASLSDWLKAADELNTMGVKVKKSGLQLGYHNHHMEFQKIDGTLIYDALLSQFDPEYIKMQFQVAVISLGYKASDYFRKYPGRFISAHLADWSAAEKKEVPLGKGAVDWKEFFETVKTGGVQNVFVEMGQDKFRESIQYIKSLK